MARVVRPLAPTMNPWSARSISSICFGIGAVHPVDECDQADSSAPAAAPNAASHTPSSPRRPLPTRDARAPEPVPRRPVHQAPLFGSPLKRDNFAARVEVTVLTPAEKPDPPVHARDVPVFRGDAPVAASSCGCTSPGRNISILAGCLERVRPFRCHRDCHTSGQYQHERKVSVQ